MKYFPRNLIDRLNSDDDAVVSEAEKEWASANERYEEHLRTLDPELPDHIRAFNNLLLHDALVWSIARRDDQLIMVLQKNIPPRDVVIITYTLTEEPIFNPEALPLERRLKVMDFQYDEFDVVREGNTQIFCQSSVFGNGWEMILRFRDVQVSLAVPLYPVPGTLLVPTTVSEMPQSA